MTVGITYDLRDDYLKEGFGEEETAEFDRADTIEAIENSLRNLGYQTERIGNIKSLVACLASGKRWDMVFNICEGLYGFGREAVVPAILEAYRIPCTFSDSLVLALTLHKGYSKNVIRDSGIPTADFFIVEKESDADAMNLPYPVIAKPIAEGTGKGIDSASKIDDSAQLRKVCAALLKKFAQPVLIEEFLPGREFTVSICGTGDASRVLGVLEVTLNQDADAEVYSYKNKEFCEDLVVYKLTDDQDARESAEVALRSWKALCCRDSGRVDIRFDKNDVPNFIEVNPIAGLNPVHSDLPITCTQAGISYQSLIEIIMKSALSRI